MAFIDIVIGSLAWGAKVNDAFRSQDARISDLAAGGGSAAQAGFKGMPYAPEMAASNTALSSGVITMTQILVPNAATLSTLTFGILTPGSGLVAGQNFGALYSSAGARVAVTADATAAFGTAGETNLAFTAPYAAAAGTYYLALLANGTTPPTVFRSVANVNASALINHGMTPATARYTTGPTGQTSMPASVTMSARTLSGTAFWMGVN